jgi:hypothetical protein
LVFIEEGRFPERGYRGTVLTQATRPVSVGRSTNFFALKDRLTDHERIIDLLDVRDGDPASMLTPFGARTVLSFHRHDVTLPKSAELELPHLVVAEQAIRLMYAGLPPIGNEKLPRADLPQTTENLTLKMREGQIINLRIDPDVGELIPLKVNDESQAG